MLVAVKVVVLNWRKRVASWVVCWFGGACSGFCDSRPWLWSAAVFRLMRSLSLWLALSLLELSLALASSSGGHRRTGWLPECAALQLWRLSFWILLVRGVFGAPRPDRLPRKLFQREIQTSDCVCKSRPDCVDLLMQQHALGSTSGFLAQLVSASP